MGETRDNFDSLFRTEEVLGLLGLKKSDIKGFYRQVGPKGSTYYCSDLYLTEDEIIIVENREPLRELLVDRVDIKDYSIDSVNYKYETLKDPLTGKTEFRLKDISLNRELDRIVRLPNSEARSDFFHNYLDFKKQIIKQLS